MTHSSTVASSMFRRGFSTSSESVLMLSNPMYVSTAIEVPVLTSSQENVDGS